MVELLPYVRGAGRDVVADDLARLALSYSMSFEIPAELVAFAGVPKPEE